MRNRLVDIGGDAGFQMDISMWSTLYKSLCQKSFQETALCQVLGMKKGELSGLIGSDRVMNGGYISLGSVEPLLVQDEMIQDERKHRIKKVVKND